MIQNTRSIVILGVFAVVIVSIFFQLNRWINLQIDKAHLTVVSEKATTGSEKSAEVLVSDGPRKLVIDPSNDPLAPRVKSSQQPHISPGEQPSPSEKIYQPSVGDILIQ